MKQQLLGILVCFSLTACSLAPVAVPPMQQYILNQVPAVAVSAQSRHAIVLVALPTTFTPYETTAIAYTKRPLQLNYFAQNQWGARPADMVQHLLVATLSRSHAYQGVVAAPYAGHANYVVRSHILELREVAENKAPYFQVRVHVDLLRGADGTLLAQKTFSAAVPLANPSIYAAMQAANRAMAEVLLAVNIFCLAHLTV